MHQCSNMTIRLIINQRHYAPRMVRRGARAASACVPPGGGVAFLAAGRPPLPQNAIPKSRGAGRRTVSWNSESWARKFAVVRWGRGDLAAAIAEAVCEA